MFSDNIKLIQNFKRFTKIYKINLNIINIGRSNNKKNLKSYFHPIILAIPIFLFFLIKRIKIFIMPIKRFNNLENNNLLFINYFMKPHINKNQFESVYWGGLDHKMHLNKIKRTWLHLYLPESNLKYKKIKKFFIDINKNTNSSHLILDKFFDFQTFLKIISIWIKIILNKKKIDKILLNNSNKYFLYFLFLNDFKENIFGYKFFFNSYYFFLFKNFFRSNNKFKQCLYLFENQSWERSLQYNLNCNNRTIRKSAVVHSSIRFWDLRYFNMTKLSRNKRLEKFFHGKKDKIIVSSKKFNKILVENKFQDNKIILLEALRYSNTNKNIYTKNKIQNKKYTNIVLVGDYDTKFNNKIELFISFLKKRKNFRIICKPHPLNNFSQNILADKKIIKTNQDIQTLSKIYDHFLVSNTSTASLELFSTGKNVMTLLDDEFVNFSPLYNYYNYDKYIFDINQIYEKIKNYKKKSNIKKFFLLNNNLMNWIKYIKKNETKK